MSASPQKKNNKNKVGAGIIARINGDSQDPTIALRADMDTLPIQEDTAHYPRSNNDGAMHACGHDAHTTGLMGAAKILKEMANREELPGNVILLFQLSEEKANQKESGAVQMVKQLERLKLRGQINAFFGMQVIVNLERGVTQIKEGVNQSNSGEVDIVLQASGGHILNRL